MSVTIYITVDLFHYYWDKPDDRQLWLAVNANIKREEADVLGWIKGSERGALFTYELVRDTVPTENMVTVNLPDDIDIRLTATDGAGTVVLEKINKRSVAVDVVDGLQFARDNLDLRGSDKFEPMRLGPFVQAFNHGARQAARGESDIDSLDPNEPAAKAVPWDRLMMMIDISLAGGARRRLREGVAQNIDQVDIMLLPIGSEPTVTVTNLHSLNGLMFKLGDASDIPGLRIVRQLTLVLEDANGVVTSMELAERPTDSDFLKRFFYNLSGNLDYGQLTATWLSEISRRVYVNDTAMVFAHRSYKDGTHWYRRRREERKGNRHDVPALTLNEVNRILVKFLPENDGDNPPAEWNRFDWEVYGSFECEMRIYRSYTVNNSGDASVLLLTPRKQDAEAFFAELETEPELLNRAILYDEMGDEVSAKFLGRFDLAWDMTVPGAKRPILYHGSMPQNGNVTVVFPRLLHNESPIRLTTIREREQDEFGDGECYWQFIPNAPLPSKRFHHLKLINPGLDEGADRLIVAVSFFGDVEFTYAQAASSIEAVIQTQIPQLNHLETKSMRSVPEEFLDDLNNFNCLNIFHTWGGKNREHLNAKREDFPVFETVDDKLRLYTYHVRFKTPAVPDVDQSKTKFDARPFFQVLYNHLGTDRMLEFDAEHTYGTHINLLEKSGISANFDFPIVLLSDIDNGAASPKHFVTVEYRGGNDNRSEEAVLHVDLNFLKPVDPADPGAVSAHIAAWRAIAETTRAETIQLFGKFRRFDLPSALREEANNSLTSALTPVDAFESLQWDVTEKIAERAWEWLYGDEDLRDASEIKIVLTEPQQPKIFRSCNVVEFRLQLSRQEDHVPDKRVPWKLVRESRPAKNDPDLFDIKGRRVVEVKASDEEYVRVRQRFNQFNLSLCQRSGPLKPYAEESPGSALVRRVLGGGDGDVCGTVDWMVPEGPIDGTGRAALAEFLPIGFRPLQRDTYLGQNSAIVFRRVFKAFDAIINGRTSTSRLTNFDDMRTHFKALEAISPSYECLMHRLTELMLPLPDPDDNDLNPNIKTLVDAVRTPDHRLSQAIRARLVEEFVTEPTRFYDMKAYLFSRLRSARGGAVSPDLFKFKTKKLIRGSGENAVFEEDSETVQTSLFELVGTDWFGFLEGLDDTSFDNEFFFANVSLLTFEAAIDAFAKAEECKIELPVGGSLTIPIQNETISLPIGEQLLTDASNQDKPVQLASRKVLSNPVLLFIGPIDECQEAERLNALIDVPLDQDALLNGIVAKPNEDTTAVVRIVQDPFKVDDRSTRWDDFTLSVIYSITGDEEAAQGAWHNAFQNDSFIIDVFADDYSPQTGRSSRTLVEPPEDLKKLLDQLVLQHDATAVKGIETIMHRASIEYLESLVRPNEPVEITYKDKIVFKIIEKSTGSGVDICDVSEPSHGLRVEAFLIKPDAPDGMDSDVDETRFFLMLNFEVVVWQRTTVTLVHGRNLGSRFAPEFGVISKTIVSQDPYSPMRSIDLYNEFDPMRLPRKTSLSARDLVQKLLIGEKYPLAVLLPESEAEPNWADFDLSISVFGDQRPELPMAVVSGGSINDQETLPLPSKHGRQRYFFKVGEFNQSYDDWFHYDYDNFVVEFQWITPSNQMIFRIENRRVRIE